MSVATGYGKEPEPPTSSFVQLSQQCRHYELFDILLATENFDESLVIGRGGFGKVYRGTIFNGSATVLAAIKRLDPNSNQGAPEFWAEVEMLSKLRHCNLVSLFGYCNDEEEMILVYEYMPNGTLEDHLHKLRTPLSWVQRLKICVGAGRGLHYLHTGTGIDVGVIHRDVKTSNILLQESWAAKISDFGLSKIGPTNQFMTYVNTLVKGTFGYFDPDYYATGNLTRKSDVYAFGVVLLEVLCRPTNQFMTYVNTLVKGTFGYFDPDYYATGNLTRKSDVYAFGVVLLEVLCRKRAIFNIDGEASNLANWAQESIKEGSLKNIIDFDIRGQISPKCSKEFVRITERCLHSSPKQRPTMTEVLFSLESILILQQKFNNSVQPAGRTILDRMVNMLPFPSNGENTAEGDSKPSSEGKSRIGTNNVGADSKPPRCAKCETYGPCYEEGPNKIISDILKNAPRLDSCGVQVGQKPKPLFPYRPKKDVENAKKEKKSKNETNGKKEDQGLKMKNNEEVGIKYVAKTIVRGHFSCSEYDYMVSPSTTIDVEDDTYDEEESNSVVQWRLLSFALQQVENSTSLNDLSSHTNQYTSPVLTQKLFANMRRVGKGFLGVETPLFATMLV
nr:receptor-like protein kinase FERONIA [Tanacetum cinerariifolium]